MHIVHVTHIPEYIYCQLEYRVQLQLRKCNAFKPVYLNMKFHYDLDLDQRMIEPCLMFSLSNLVFYATINSSFRNLGILFFELLRTLTDSYTARQTDMNTL